MQPVAPARPVSELRLGMKSLGSGVEDVVRQANKDLTDITSATRVGYVRVSTATQTLDQQEQALAATGVTKTFSDTMSGARDDRPGLAALMEYVLEGDTVVAWKLDRLGRNMRIPCRQSKN